MGKLIDADAMYKRYCVDKEGLDGIYDATDLPDMLASMPTIDAIPVGWLIDRANDPERAPLYRRYAQMLYEEWQKEQEAK